MNTTLATSSLFSLSVCCQVDTQAIYSQTTRTQNSCPIGYFTS
ncbi:hypothetical protein AB4145_06560 [Vibrio splendidus]